MKILSAPFALKRLLLTCSGIFPSDFMFYERCTLSFNSYAFRLPCNANHTFHRDCIIEWSQMPQNRVDVSCPNCREQLPQNIFLDLQKPFSWVDMIMLPLMLIFLIFQYIPVALGEAKNRMPSIFSYSSI